MKNVLFVVLLVACFSLACLPAKADVYISQAGGGSGTSCASPQNVAYFNTAANWGAGHPIAPGTTVHLCGTFTGAAGSTMLTFQGSGASGSPITLKFEQNAKLSAPYWAAGNGQSPGGGAINLAGQGFLVIDGGVNGIIENTQNGTGLTYQQSSLAISAVTAHDLTIKNLTIQNLYIHTDPNDTTSISNDGCIALLDSNNVTIDSITAHDTHWCLTGATNNASISHLNIYNMDHGLALGNSISGKTYSNITIFDSHFHDMANWDTTTNAYHHDGIHIWGEHEGGGNQTCTATNTGTIMSNITIYNNLFDGDPGANLTGEIYLECYDTNVNIFNNVFSYPPGRGSSDGIIAQFNHGGPNTQNLTVLNNTVLGADKASADGCVSFNKSGTDQKDITFLDNVAADCTITLVSANATFALGSTNPPAGLNYNVYHEDETTSNEFSYLGTFYHDLAHWQTATAQDANATFVPIATDLGLSNDGIVKPGSPVIGKGENLTALCTGSLAPLCFDKGGTTRPTTGSWDAGAYQFGTHLISRVQTINPAFIHSNTLTASLTETAGNFLIAATAYQVTGTTVTVTDSLGNTWNSLPAYNNSSCGTTDGNYSGVQLWYAQNIRGGANVVTMTTNNTTYIWLGVVEYSGVATSSALETTTGAAATTSSTTISTGNMSATGANNLIFGFFHDQRQGSNMTPASGYTDDANSGLTSMLEDLFPTGPGTYNPSATYTGAADSCGVATGAVFVSK